MVRHPGVTAGSKVRGAHRASSKRRCSAAARSAGLGSSASRRRRRRLRASIARRVSPRGPRMERAGGIEPTRRP